MAKMDEAEDAPKVFLENGLYVLPVSRNTYAIVHGKGFEPLEPPSDKASVYTTGFSLPTSTEGSTNENTYLDYSYSSGLLGEFTKVSDLYLGFRGKRGTAKFSFNIDSLLVNVDGAGMEVDHSYENGRTIIDVEAKARNRLPSSFNIRQLYYPFRTFYGKKDVRSIFFFYDLVRKRYLFWEYEFSPHTRFEPSLVQSSSFEVKVQNAVAPKTYGRTKPIKESIPQADSVDKILLFPMRVAEGYDTSDKMKDALGFTRRQSSYYREASETLGLVDSVDTRYRLTEAGERLLRMNTSERIRFMTQLILSYSITNQVFLEALVNSEKAVTVSEITQLIRKESRLTRTTLRRRAQTVVAWFRWIQRHVGIVAVGKNGDVSIARQSKL